MESRLDDYVVATFVAGFGDAFDGRQGSIEDAGSDQPSVEKIAASSRNSASQTGVSAHFWLAWRPQVYCWTLALFSLDPYATSNTLNDFLLTIR